ncbi:MAG: dihydrolipoyl dehydrogenase [Burkholderiales bacterium]|nr:dihydrolipoyl dehydrogenase [Burkholderiales bacterium]GIK87222.1 MAG: dihydrolipoyl dehydrogenase [Betaproteobacteria bacterium]
MSDIFDVAVIGAGPGGYIAAIRAAQLGLSVACVDDWTREGGKPAPGGTCTNVGCIPSKALLQSSEHYAHAAHAFRDHGIDVTGLSIDVARMLARKDRVVAQNNDGIAFLFRKHKIRFLHGRGSFAGGNAKDGWTLAVEGADRTEIVARHVIVATGSKPRPLPGVPFDNDRVLDNAGALAIASVPATLGVVGAGVIGLEMGSVWRRLGADVTILEALPAFLGAADEAVAREARKAFARQGLAIHLGVSIAEVTPARDAVAVAWKDERGEAQTATFERLIVAIGRVPNTDGLGAEAVGLTVDERGFVAVDGECRTNLPQVWAVGDVVRGPMLAHKAEEEGVAVAERIAGGHGHVDFDTVPWVIYTSPEIAWVGRTEQQLRADGVAYRSGSFPFSANGRARALGDTTGFVKILADAKTDRILGMHVVGPYASELIAEGVVAMEFGASSEDIARICHAHPSLSEATKEAALAVDKRTLNL